MRISAFASLVATALLGVCVGSEAAASDLVARPFMPLGVSVDAPRGYVDMCRIRTQLCLDEDPRGQARLAVQSAAAQDGAGGAQVASTQADAPAVSAPREGFVAPALLRQPDFTSSISVSFLMDANFVRPAFLRRAFVEPAFLRAPIVPVEAPPAPPVVSEPSESEAMNSVVRKKMLDKVNRAVNSRVRAVTDMARYGVDELWNRTGMERGAAGDCEDFAIEKREQLIALGYPTKDLFFAVAFRADLGLHAVLVAHTDEGDFVLDNRSAYVTPWAKAPYIWVKRQSQDDPMRWGLVDDSISAPAFRAREVQVAALSPELASTAASAGQ